jgi:L-2-hydroxyglutarate oxidase
MIESMGGEIRTGERVTALSRANGGGHVRTPSGTKTVTTIVNCAGLHADRVARLAAERIDSRVMPSRGEYWMLAPERNSLVPHLIYPVPDPTFPFLGVHLIHGDTEGGPNAVLALAREG